MKIISKSQILALTLSLGIFLALGTVSAFTPPTVGQPTGSDWQNIAEPFDESANFQMKDGGLSVNTFTASGPSAFIQDLSLNGLVNGGTETDTTSSLAFGDGSSTVNIRAIGSLRSNVSFTSESLAHSGSGLEPICADTLGHLILCPVTSPSGPICGNTVIESGEQCDDGNTSDGDGCSSVCRNEVSVSYYLNMTCSAFNGGGCTGSFRDSKGFTYTVSTTNSSGSLSVPPEIYEWLGGDVNQRWTSCPVPGDWPDINPPAGTILELGPAPLAQSFDVEVGCH